MSAPAISDATVVARVAVSEATARQLIAVLGESLDATHTVVSAFEDPKGDWQIAIQIEAALAFGTGHHGTTRGCLLALDRIHKARRPRGVLDVGTGSGVLAVAAARALHRPILASDIDITAVRAARENVGRNRAGSAVTVIHAKGLGARLFRQRAPFDLIFANILLGPLKVLARPIDMLAAPHAEIVLSGLLSAHANAALSAYRSRGLSLRRRIDLDGWTTLILRRGVAARRQHQ